MQPPQLDNSATWRQRLATPWIIRAQLAASNPAQGLVTHLGERAQLYAWDVPTGTLRQLTDDPIGIMTGVLAPDGRWVYYHQSEKGNETGHMVRVPIAGGAAEDITPDRLPYTLALLSLNFAISRAGNRIGLLPADAHGFDVLVLDVAADGALSAPRVVYHSARLLVGPVLSYDGDIAVVDTTERSGTRQFSLIALDTATGATLAELWDGPGTSVEAIMGAPLPGDGRILATTNRAGARRPVLWNPRTGARRDLDLPELAGDVVPYDWSGDGQRLLLGQFSQAVQQLYLYDLAADTLARIDHPHGAIGVAASDKAPACFAPDGEIFVVWQDGSHPLQVIALDGATGRQRRTVLAGGPVPAGYVRRSITYTSSDGQPIQGWLSVPDGAGPFPTILMTHGGPHDVDIDRFSPVAQMWADHGVALLSINYRGSTTFGSDHQYKILGAPGHWELEDMVAARDWLVAEGIAIPEQILLYGGSYGGYLTLLGLGRRPELWAGGIAQIPIADLTSTYADSSEMLKAATVSRFGGTPEELPELYRAASPITYADAVAAPVLIFAGRNDTRCPPRQVADYVATLERLGKPVEIHWNEGGHGGGSRTQAVEDYERMLRFVYDILEARQARSV